MDEKNQELFLKKVAYFVWFWFIHTVSFGCFYRILDILLVEGVSTISLFGPMVVLYSVLVYRLLADLFTLRVVIGPEIHSIAIEAQDWVLSIYDRVTRRNP